MHAYKPSNCQHLAHENVVHWDVHQLDDEAKGTQHQEAHTSDTCNLLKLCKVQARRRWNGEQPVQ